jgi:hypothetical protein
MASLAQSSKDFLIKMAEGLHMISKRLLQLTEGTKGKKTHPIIIL